jgi:hypothetical protein
MEPVDRYLEPIINPGERLAKARIAVESGWSGDTITVDRKSDNSRHGASAKWCSLRCSTPPRRLEPAPPRNEKIPVVSGAFRERSASIGTTQLYFDAPPGFELDSATIIAEDKLRPSPVSSGAESGAFPMIRPGEYSQAMGPSSRRRSPKHLSPCCICTDQSFPESSEMRRVTFRQMGAAIAFCDEIGAF